MKITGHTCSVTIRSQLETQVVRAIGFAALAASPEFTQEHCVLLRHCTSADSSYLNRPIVGPTPPKLPASWSSNLRHHRVVCGVSRRTLIILLYPRHSVKGISQIFRENFVQADSVFLSPFQRPDAPIYNSINARRNISLFPHFRIFLFALLTGFSTFFTHFPAKSRSFPHCYHSASCIPFDVMVE